MANTILAFGLAGIQSAGFVDPSGIGMATILSGQDVINHDNRPMFRFESTVQVSRLIFTSVSRRQNNFFKCV